MEEKEGVKMGVEALMESVESEKNIEVAVMGKGGVTVNVSPEDIEAIVEEIKKEKAA